MTAKPDHPLDASAMSALAPLQAPPAQDRRALRAHLLATRAGLAAGVRAGFDARIAAALEQKLAQGGANTTTTTTTGHTGTTGITGTPTTQGAVAPFTAIATYWPMRAEPDLRPLMAAWHARGLVVALPRVVRPGTPLTFARWTPDTIVEEHRYGALLPADAPEVVPELLIIPCVGFDARRYRLGYGGGYYDRTLAGGRFASWGVAYECARLDALAAEAHDRPLDLIVTEAALY